MKTLLPLRRSQRLNPFRLSWNSLLSSSEILIHPSALFQSKIENSSELRRQVCSCTRNQSSVRTKSSSRRPRCWWFGYEHCYCLRRSSSASNRRVRKEMETERKKLLIYAPTVTRRSHVRERCCLLNVLGRFTRGDLDGKLYIVDFFFNSWVTIY